MDSMRASFLVHAVDVLSHHHGIGGGGFELGDQPVSCVRLAGRGHLPTHVVEIPHPFGIAVEGTLAGIGLPVVRLPHATASPVSRHTALGAHPRSGEKHHAREVTQSKTFGVCRHSATILTWRSVGHPIGLIAC
jgi:hypothetical protein